MANATNNKFSLKMMKISDEDLIEAGCLPFSKNPEVKKESSIISRGSKMQEAKAGSNAKGIEFKMMKIDPEDIEEANRFPGGPKMKESKPGPKAKVTELKMIKIDPKEIEEVALIVKQPDNHDAKAGLRTSKPLYAKQRKESTIFNIKKTSAFNQRTSNIQKDMAKKAVKNITTVFSNGGRSTGKDDANFLEPENIKFNVRKKLFRMSTTNRTQKSKNENEVPRSSRATSNSPLMDINTVEELLLQKNSFQATKKSIIPSQNSNTRLSIVEEENQSLSPSERGSTSSIDNRDDTEFENMEQMCKTQEFNDRINKIQTILNNDAEEFQKYKDSREKKIIQINQILEEIIRDTTHRPDEKYQRKRLSKPKTPKRTPFKAVNYSDKSDSLRRNVLLKNIGTPKSQKAEKMYSNLRDQYGILETPRSNAKLGNNNISLKVHEQCHMLLETPKPNK